MNRFTTQFYSKIDEKEYMRIWISFYKKIFFVLVLKCCFLLMIIIMYHFDRKLLLFLYLAIFVVFLLISFFTSKYINQILFLNSIFITILTIYFLYFYTSMHVTKNKEYNEKDFYFYIRSFIFNFNDKFLFQFEFYIKHDINNFFFNFFCFLLTYQ